MIEIIPRLNLHFWSLKTKRQLSAGSKPSPSASVRGILPNMLVGCVERILSVLIVLFEVSTIENLIRTWHTNG